MKNTVSFFGNIRRNNGGQIIVDYCGSDQVHLRDSVTDPSTNRPQCRKTVDACFDGLIGLTGKLTISVQFEEDVVGAVPQHVHDAETVKQRLSSPGAMAEAVIAALEDLDGN